jgi:uncharacterized membrane protein
MASKNNNFFKLWGMPIWMAVVTMLGLIFALIGTGIWHVVSWIALCIPVYVMWKYGRKFFNINGKDK